MKENILLYLAEVIHIVVMTLILIYLFNMPKGYAFVSAMILNYLSDIKNKIKP